MSLRGKSKNELLVLTGAVYSFVAYLIAFTLEVLFIVDLAKRNANGLLALGLAASVGPARGTTSDLTSLSDASPAASAARFAYESMQTHITISCLAISILYFVMFVASLILILALVLRSTFLILIWMCIMTTMYLPEFGLIMYVSLYAWGIDSRNGQTELLFYLLRATLNVIFIFRAHRLFKQWNYEKNFLMLKQNARFSAYDSPYFISGDSLTTTINPMFSSSTLDLGRYDHIRQLATTSSNSNNNNNNNSVDHNTTTLENSATKRQHHRGPGAGTNNLSSPRDRYTTSTSPAGTPMSLGQTSSGIFIDYTLANSDNDVTTMAKSPSSYRSASGQYAVPMLTRDNAHSARKGFYDFRNPTPPSGDDDEDAHRRKQPAQKCIARQGNKRQRTALPPLPNQRQSQHDDDDDDDEDFTECELDIDYRTFGHQARDDRDEIKRIAQEQQRQHSHANNDSRHQNYRRHEYSQPQPEHERYRRPTRTNHAPRPKSMNDSLVSYSTQSLDRRRNRDLDFVMPGQVLLRPITHRPFEYLRRPGSSNSLLANDVQLNTQPL